MDSAEMCPKCGSLDWRPILGTGYTFGLRDCQECGYRGTFILVDADKVEETREEIRKMREG